MKIFNYWFLFLSLILNSIYVDAKTSSWYSLTSNYSFQEVDGETITPKVFTIDMNKAFLRIVSVPFEANKKVGNSEVSIRDFATILSKKSKYRKKEWILVNGSFSSYRGDVPVGLLVVDEKIYSRVSTLKNSSPISDPTLKESDFAEYRWSGILCQSTQNKIWDIISVKKYEQKHCLQAIQAGPVIVEPDSKLGVSDVEVNKEPYNRSVLCLTNDNKVNLIIVEQKIHLLPLAKWLIKAKNEGGLGCRIALNLSGDSSSGIATKLPRNNIIFYGEGTYPIPSALIFEKK